MIPGLLTFSGSTPPVYEHIFVVMFMIFMILVILYSFHYFRAFKISFDLHCLYFYNIHACYNFIFCFHAF